MKRCARCEQLKLGSEFPIRRDRGDGRGTICLACGRLYHRAHYAANVQYYVAKSREARRRSRPRIRERLFAYLRTHPCVDCGERDIRVLQFDHIDPKTKTAEVGKLLRGATWTRIAREIDKCQVRCGNCHRRKTLRMLHRDRSDDRRVSEATGPWSSVCGIIDAGPLAQWIERPPSKRKCASSILARPAGPVAAARYGPMNLMIAARSGT